MHTLRIALAQINCTVGAISENTEKILEYLEKAKALDADLVAFPELAITGYPPEDLLFKPHFIDENLRALDTITQKTKGIAAVVGYVDRVDDIYNAAAFLNNGSLVHVHHKSCLPNYGVFDEDRYFQAGTSCAVIHLNDVRIGINICEDIWNPEGPALTQTLVGEAQVIVNINASPYHRGKEKLRHQMLSTRARDNRSVIAYLNLVGGQDELIHDGGSLIMDETGKIAVRARKFEEDLLVADINIDAVFRVRLRDSQRRKLKLSSKVALMPIDRFEVKTFRRAGKRRRLHYRSPEPLHSLSEVYQALVLGIKDYVGKNRFSKVVIGLSGGIDSALTAVLAVDALGRDNVAGIFMPSEYTSRASEEDVQLLAKALGIRLHTIPIHETFKVYLEMLSREFKGKPIDVTEENLQARIRGNILMAFSNKFGWLVLTTGNKSEMSVGYATLYGDMAGGFAVIKDVPKMLVYELSHHWNSLAKSGRGGPIPERILKRAPTAELRPNQTDQDSLPPYEILDPILQAYVEEDRGLDEIISLGFERAIVEKVIRLVDASEYKRRQAPIGIKITPRAFGKDRRIPVTHRYQES